MGKKKNSPTDDLEMYTGLVRLYTGDPQKAQAIEDMMIERFPATTSANAQQFLIMRAKQWLRENGYPNGGVRVLYCRLDDEEPAKAGRSTRTAWDAVNQPTPDADTNPVRKERRKVEAAYVAYKCPIVQTCSTRFVGRYDAVSGYINTSKEETTP